MPLRYHRAMRSWDVWIEVEKEESQNIQTESGSWDRTEFEGSKVFFPVFHGTLLGPL